MVKRIGFIGGGNMATAIMGGLIRKGMQPNEIHVVEPWAQARERLNDSFGIYTHEAAGEYLRSVDLIIWAVKPQIFHEATQQIQPFLDTPLHLSVAAGISTDSISRWLGTEQVIRCMPNTPALIGLGMTALFARQAVSRKDKDWASEIISTTGDFLWVQEEDQLNAVTALSGSGPAYVYYFLEAMIAAGIKMGLQASDASRLACQTFIGAGSLANTSDETPQTLRDRVTSKGGTTFEAISSMDRDNIQGRFIDALFAAHKRAEELGREFGNKD